jgi:PBP4 family serine-type D-alanyl-D-alanine carboxypeptidase
VCKVLCMALLIGALLQLPVKSETLDALMARAQARHAIVAGEVYDLDAHKVPYAHNAQQYMEAASNTKLLTMGTSLALLGPDFKFTTPVYRTGPIDPSGMLHGDVVLVASGDPNLSQRMQPDGTLAFMNSDHEDTGFPDAAAVPGDPLLVLRELANQVVKSGVKRIDGRVIVDASLFQAQGIELESSVTLTPIVVNDNLVDIMMTPGAKPGDPVSISVSPQTPYVTFVNKMTTGAGGSEFLAGQDDVANADGSRTVTLTGTIPPRTPMLQVYAVADPTRFAQTAFAMVIKDAGVIIDTPASAKPFSHDEAVGSYVAANRIAEHVSAPLSEDVKVTLKVSQNTHAAMQIPLWAVYVAHAKSDFMKIGFAQEAAVIRKASLDLNSAAQQDGDGSASFYTPDFLVHWLAWISRQSWYAAFHRALPVLGVDGTIYDIQTSSPAKGKVFAKTGTTGPTDLLNDRTLMTKALAGYTTTRSGHHVAFAFSINRLPGRVSLYADKDIYHFAGELLGSMATATYLNY